MFSLLARMHKDRPLKQIRDLLHGGCIITADITWRDSMWSYCGGAYGTLGG